MKKVFNFVKKHTFTIMTAASALAIVVANASPSGCFLCWEYEEEMPKCLQDS